MHRGPRPRSVVGYWHFLPQAICGCPQVYGASKGEGVRYSLARPSWAALSLCMSADTSLIRLVNSGLSRPTSSQRVIKKRCRGSTSQEQQAMGRKRPLMIGFSELHEANDGPAKDRRSGRFGSRLGAARPAHGKVPDIIPRLLDNKSQQCGVFSAEAAPENPGTALGGQFGPCRNDAHLSRAACAASLIYSGTGAASFTQRGTPCKPPSTGRLQMRPANDAIMKQARGPASGCPCGRHCQRTLVPLKSPWYSSTDAIFAKKYKKPPPSPFDSVENKLGLTSTDKFDNGVH